MVAPQDEIVTIVDEKNNVTGSALRSVMRAKGLPHRATYILVFNSKGELYVQKRTPVKDIYPGYYDVAAGGVVMAGESYDESASRELNEEMGMRAYRCVYDGKIVLQEEEVESGDFYTLDAVLQSSKHDSYTPDGFYVLRRYLDQRTQR
jgi:isopentenyldiphosphate isomerase